MVGLGAVAGESAGCDGEGVRYEFVGNDDGVQGYWETYVEEKGR